MDKLNRNHVFAFGLALVVLAILVLHYYSDTPPAKAGSKEVVTDKWDKEQAQANAQARRKQALYNMELAAAHLDRASWQLAVARWKGSDPTWVKLMEEERIKAWTEVREAAADLADLK